MISNVKLIDFKGWHECLSHILSSHYNGTMVHYCRSLCSLLSPNITSSIVTKSYEFHNRRKEIKFFIIDKSLYQLLPLFFVTQLHLFNSPVPVSWLCCCAFLSTGASLLSGGAISRSAKDIFWSSGVVESVREESFEFCDHDRDNDDRDNDELLLWSPIG